MGEVVAGVAGGNMGGRGAVAVLVEAGAWRGEGEGWWVVGFCRVGGGSD